MDAHFPHKEAPSLIQQWSTRLAQPEAPFIHLGLAVPASAMQSGQISFVMDADGRAARAMFVKNQSAPAEAVFTVVGILQVKDLPPVSRATVRPAQLKHMKQHATIVGYHSGDFDRAVQNIQDLSFEMTRFFDDGVILPWSPVEHSAADISDAVKIPFDNRTDPHGVLSDMNTPTLAHCLDNDVAYLGIGNETYKPHLPASFRVGDVVEMGFAVVAWKLAKVTTGPQFIFSLVLRSLVFLDGSLTKKAAIARSHRASNGPRTSLAPVVHNEIAKRMHSIMVEQDQKDDLPEVDRKLAKMSFGETQWTGEVADSVRSKISG
ncbi:hypothetical protein K438DRAFT_1964324 [Mycena galopus ATCC 62051]|nr:hypothetical protein K438DRAFT_1964324 [Mycena galopus ATCC 62051]